MTTQNIAGAPFLCFPFHPLFPWNQTPTAVDNAIDAAGEAMIFVGNIIIPTGGSKTISSAGGSITFITGACTFASASTNLRIGIQDVDTANGPPARGDGSYDVRGDYLGNSGAISGTAVNTLPMLTGSKTIAHGDQIAIYIALTARGGADSVTIRNPSTVGTGGLYPLVVAFQSSAYAWTGTTPNVYLTFDDGTFGFLDCGWIGNLPGLFATQAFNSGSTPDEYCNIFQLPFPCRVTGLYANLVPVSGAANFELILYSDPLGTPAAMATVAVDANVLGSTAASRNYHAMLGTAQDLSANTNYAIAVRPTTANNVTVAYTSVSNTSHWDGMPMGQNCYYATRTDQTGAFSATTNSRLFAGVRVSGFSDGAGGSGGGIRLAGHGGLAA